METNVKRREDILKLRNKGKTYNEIAKELKCGKSIVAYYCNENRFSIEKTRYAENNKKEFEELVVKAVKDCDNLNQVCKLFGLKATNNVYKRLYKIIEKYNVDITHFKVDYRHGKRQRKSTDEIFCDNSTYPASKLKNILIKQKIKNEVCECCGNSEWMGEKIPLQVHHKNGINNDNRVENLQLLCPNCHSLTDNYCGKNKHNKLKKIYKENVCPVCGKVFNGKTKFCSKECNEAFKDKKRKEENKIKPSKEKIIELMRSTKNLCKVARYFKITDNALRKWCRKYKLPTHSKELLDFCGK